MVRSGIPGKEARPRNKVGVVFSILIPFFAAILLFVVIQAKLRGEQLPDFVIFVEALGFVVVILAGTWFLISRCAGAPGERGTLSPDGQPHPGDFLDARRRVEARAGGK